MIGGGKHFPREDNCRKHMRKHGFVDREKDCEMDDQTRRIRKERKVVRRIKN